MSYAERQPLSTSVIGKPDPAPVPVPTERMHTSASDDAEQLARDLLGVSATAAFAKLDAGDLDGTVHDLGVQPRNGDAWSTTLYKSVGDFHKKFTDRSTFGS